MTPTRGRQPRPAAPAAFGPVQPICWPTLTEEDQASMLTQLTDWVDWLTWRYTLDHRVIPHCWTQHGPHIEELSALFTAWQTAYTTSATGDAPMLWIEHFHHARARLTDWTARTGCRPGEHRPTASVGSAFPVTTEESQVGAVRRNQTSTKA